MIRTTLAVALSFFALAATTGCLAQGAPGNAKESPEQKQVRSYLKENLPTGKWEEVRWWPVVRLIDNGKPSNAAIRLKYRTENQFGGTSLRDDVFEFTGKRMIYHGPDSVVNMNRERIFNRKP